MDEANGRRERDALRPPFGVHTAGAELAVSREAESVERAVLEQHKRRVQGAKHLLAANIARFGRQLEFWQLAAPPRHLNTAANANANRE